MYSDYRHWPEFTKEVCQQTLVFVRHMTRFYAFFTNLVCKEEKEVWRNKTRFVDKPWFVHKPPLSIRAIMSWGFILLHI